MDAPVKTRFPTERRRNPATNEFVQVSIEDEDVADFFYPLAYHYHYLSPRFLAALAGRNYVACCRRTHQLREPGNNYLRLAPEQEEGHKPYWGDLFYAIGKKGLDALSENGYEPPKRVAPYNLKHTAMVDQIMASIEIGVNADDRMEILWWEDLIEKGIIPPTSKPYINLSGDRTAHPDRYPFILKRSFDKPLFILGYEAETGAHSFHRVRDKFKNYIEVITNKLYKEHYGRNSCYIPFFTPNDLRLHKFMDDLRTMTKEIPTVRKHFLFMTHPLYNSKKKAEATGHVLTEPFKRVGYPPVYLNQPIDNTPEE